MNPTQSVTKRSEKEMTFIPHGSKDTIRLSVAIVKSLLCAPTKSGAICSDRDALKFMMMCQARRLNPFEGDAFLLGYDGKAGPQFSLITAHQAFLKRAEVHPEFDGMESGVTLRKPDGATLDVPGDYFDAETDGQLVAGWARVHFKHRTIPTYRRVKLSRFQKPFGVWQEDPAGMIVKVAEADALRSSFPTLLGGCYTGEEGQSASPELTGIVVSPPPEDATPDKTAQIPAQASQQQADDVPMEYPAVPEARSVAEAPSASEEPKLSLAGELAKIVSDAGHDFSKFRAWADDSGNLENATSYASFGELPAKFCERMIKAKVGLVRGLNALTKGGKE